MPRVTKKERRLARCENMAINDVTLGDFANASMNNPSAHVRKSVVNAQLDAKNLNMTSKVGKEDLSWFEKDLDEFEIVDETTEESNNQENDQAEPASPRKVNRVRKGRELCRKKGIDYPVDLWYQLSYYVYPESVSVFSRLCKSTNQIVCTVAFWKNLYQRFYNKEIKLPKTLQPLCLERIHSLQPNVVRALYHFYQPFIDRLNPASTFEAEPHKLIGRRCLLYWYQPVKNMWNFCFKLVRPGMSCRTVCKNQQTYIDNYDDIFYNVEEGCTILQVTCSHFLSLPIAMGQILNHVHLTVSGQGFRYHTLRLVFDTRYQHNRDAVGTTVVLDSVVNIKVIPWWDPKYPFSS